MTFNSPTVAVNSFVGLLNKADPRSFGLNGFTIANNVVIDGDGVLMARVGMTRVNTTAYRGAYGTPDKSRAYAVTVSGDLEDWTTDAAPVLRSGFTGYPYWAQVGDVVFVGNETQVWRITPSRVEDNAFTQPQPLKLTPVTGHLAAGQYRFVQVGVDHRESAPSVESIITLDGTQDVLVEGITGQRLYVAPANSKVFGWWRDTTASSLVYAAHADELGEGLRSFNMRPMPFGKCLCIHEMALHASVYDARTKLSVLYRSVPQWWDLTTQTDGLIDFTLVPGEIRAMGTTPQGLVIGTDQRIYSLADGVLTVLAEYGVPPGQAMSYDEKGGLWVWTNRGLASALPFTEVIPHYAPPEADFVGTIVKREGGDTRFVATVSPLTADNAV